MQCTVRIGQKKLSSADNDEHVTSEIHIQQNAVFSDLHSLVGAFSGKGSTCQTVSVGNGVGSYECAHGGGGVRESGKRKEYAAYHKQNACQSNCGAHRGEGKEIPLFARCKHSCAKVPWSTDISVGLSGGIKQRVQCVVTAQIVVVHNNPPLRFSKIVPQHLSCPGKSHFHRGFGESEGSGRFTDA